MATERLDSSLTRTGVWLLAAACLLAWPASASAQANKLGFRVGEKSKLHTNLDIATAFDSNRLRRGSVVDGQTVSVDGNEDARLVVRPALELDVPGRSVQFRIGAGATISQFFGAGGQVDSQTLFGLDGNLYLRVGSTKSFVSFIVENSPILTPTVMDQLGTIGSDEVLFPAFTDLGRVLVTLRPGGGALEFDIGYKNQFVIYTDGGRGPPDDGFTNLGFLEARLKFLPKTAALFYAEFGAFDVSNSRRATTTLESNPFQVLVGLIGQITRTISAEIRAGYAETLVWDRAGGRFSSTAVANQRSPVGMASVRWQIIQTAQVSLTYQRTLQPIVALSSMTSDAVRLRASWNIDRLVLGGYAEYQFRDFGTVDPTDPNQMGMPGVLEPEANLIFGGAKADYYFLDWLIGGLNYRFMLQSSNDEGRGFAVPQLGGFDRHQVFGRVGIRY